MKDFLKIRTLAKVLLVMVAGLVVACFTGLAGGGMIMAMAAGVAGQSVTTENVKGQSPDLNLDTILPQITEISPGRAPLDTLIRRVGRGAKAKSWKVDEYEIVERPFEDTVAAAYAVVAGAKSAAIINVLNKF